MSFLVLVVSILADPLAFASTMWLKPGWLFSLGSADVYLYKHLNYTRVKVGDHCKGDQSSLPFRWHACLGARDYRQKRQG
ncbi:uncharacterized protein GGS22DRAFT_79063 [Annulohypoxylon maeteangense]|uniref:uncharacterized protein n=1 Tax=Annulohypoxylon maeteangense TaxID=1927788 RepID=UPI002007D890|nr:uncharacterized protein GGS22DRAFT_79063 [Annulohypoxylon maeteangense]KAI0881003.1 hypothetical protein GGS22DRAFT_79063 [Annulohypoxylon maeteangense]